jgi:tetratricopeptide (TPR) repeat protein
VLLALIVAAPLAAQDWVGRGRAHGEIVDEEGNPIQGAKVTLHLPNRPDAGPEPEMTKKNGRWAFGGLTGGDWTVVIEKEGYATSEGSFRVNEFSVAQALRVELQKDSYSGIQTGQDLIDQGDYAAARAEFEAVLPNMEPPQQAQLRALIGTTYYEEKNFEAAVQAYEQAMPALNEQDKISIRLRLGDSYLQLGQHEKARQIYEESLAGLEPEGQNQVLLAIARTYDVQGDRDNAIASVERILENDPENTQALQLIADLLSRAGREDEAQAYLDQIPEDEELPVDMLLNQGIRFYNEQKLDEAKANFDRVIRQDDSLADAYYYRGLVNLAQGDNAAALTDFHRNLELAPDGQYAADVKEFVSYLESP